VLEVGRRTDLADQRFYQLLSDGDLDGGGSKSASATERLRLATPFTSRRPY
jgi:hypothetical protein